MITGDGARSGQAYGLAAAMSGAVAQARTAVKFGCPKPNATGFMQHHAITAFALLDAASLRR
ncbi:hypothetical protein D9M72_354180 [compost metagenome]